MLEYIAKIQPYIPTFSLILSLIAYITNEKRARRKEKAEREQLEAKQHESGVPLPPRSKKHRKR